MNLDKKEIKNIIQRTDALLTENEAKLLFSLAKDIPQKGAIVEIGSFKRGSTVLLGKGAKLSKKGKVYAIDPHYDAFRPFYIGNKFYPKNTKEIFIKNIEKENLKYWFIPIIKTSEQAAKNWKKPIRFLWIDGNHDYEYVKKDFLLWEKYLVKGGVIGFHDSLNLTHKGTNLIVKKNNMYYTINNADIYEGPMKVVKEKVLKSGRFSGIKIVDTTTLAIKKENAVKVLNTLGFFRKLKCNSIYNLLVHYIRVQHLLNMVGGEIGIIIKEHFPRLYYKLDGLRNRFLGGFTN